MSVSTCISPEREVQKVPLCLEILKSGGERPWAALCNASVSPESSHRLGKVGCKGSRCHSAWAAAQPQPVLSHQDNSNKWHYSRPSNARKTGQPPACAARRDLHMEKCWTLQIEKVIYQGLSLQKWRMKPSGLTDLFIFGSLWYIELWYKENQ